MWRMNSRRGSFINPRFVVPILELSAADKLELAGNALLWSRDNWVVAGKGDFNPSSRCLRYQPTQISAAISQSLP